MGNGRKRERIKNKNKKNRFDEFLPDPEQRITKKFKNLKNTITTSFQAKIRWERPRKSENKIKKSFR